MTIIEHLVNYMLLHTLIDLYYTKHPFNINLVALGDESVVVGVQSSTYITQQKKLASLVVAP
jgi:hypothetical protein